jgi:PAS domain S-box-containing protein
MPAPPERPSRHRSAARAGRRRADAARPSSSGREAIEALLALNPVPSLVHDAATGRILAVNERAIERYGYSREQFLSLTVAALRVSGEGGHRAAGSAGDGVVHHRRADGTIIAFQVEKSPVVIDGRPAILTLAIAAGEHEQRPRDIVESMADWLWTCDAEGRVTHLSPTFEAATGVASERLLGQRLADIAPLDLAAEAAREQQAAIAAGRPFRDLVFRAEARDGGRVWLKIAGTPVFDGGGGFRGYQGMGHHVTAAIEAERASREREQRLRQLFEVASDWYWEHDEHGRIVYVSPNFEAMYGVSLEQTRGKRFIDLPHARIDPAMAAKALAAIKARQPYRDLIYFERSASGKIIRILTSAIPTFDSDGVFRGYCGVSKDITAQYEAEQAVSQSEQRFRQLFEIASDYFWETDTKNRMTKLSPNYEAFFGVRLADALGKRLTDIAGVSIDPEREKPVIEAIKARRPYRDFIYSRSLPNGGKRWISISGTPIFAEDGTFQGYRGVGADVTARVEAEVAARLAQRRLHDAVGHVTQPFIVYDAEDRAVAFNQAFTDLHRGTNGYTPMREGISYRELSEWRLQTGFYADGPDDEPVDHEQFLARHATEGEHTYHLRDGRWMLAAYRRLPGGGRVGLWTDVTQIKRAEEERRSSESRMHHSQRLEALGTLAGGVAHDLNNALVPVLALTKLVAGRLPDDSRERRNLDTVVQAAARARDLVKQVLSFSRKEEQRREEIDLAAVTSEALGLLRASVPSTIRLDETIAPTPLILGDAGQWHQVIVNLVTNAAQAIGETHGTISVLLRAEPDGRHLRLTVADTGCGMDEGTRARIFEPFFTTKEVGQGTGLGLSVVHGIVTSHGGRIDVESTPGRGTQIHIVLPIPAADAGAAA